MGFDLDSGDDVREASLRPGRRGYRKDDVEAFRNAVAELVDDLGRRLDAATAHLAELGLDEPLDLKQEFASVGKEVTAILEAARTAATDIRRRASADGERWREEAGADAERMRTEAWEEATAHLEASVAEAAQTRSAADEDALFIRAQAEKEAIRLTTESRRDGEDTVRSARAEADAIIAEAREAAEAAQERTRALEIRREELMKELEEVRRAIGTVEAQIEADQQRLVATDTPTVRIVGQEAAGPAAIEPDDRDWLDDDGTVRLVPASRPDVSSEPALEPVIDADDIVAEVERLQVEPRPWGRSEPGTRRASVEQVPVVEAPPAETRDAALDISQDSETDDDTGVEAAPPEDTDEETPGGEDVPDADGEQPAAPEVPEEPETIEAEVGVDEASPDGLADLFASLRAPGPGPPGGVVEVASVRSGTGAAVTEASVIDDAPASATGETDDVAAPSGDDRDVLEERESVLLPIVNRGLRAVKKQILEFQNVMLEATKADPDGWRPDAEEYRLALDPHVQAVVDEAHQAASGTGRSGVAVEFGLVLARAVDQAAETMEGSGYRETSASLGRVFRSWRSDEAERRLMGLAEAAYEAVTASRSSS